MKSLLGRAGSWSYRRPWFVISFWVVILVLVGVLAKQFYIQPSNSVSIPGTSAQKALDRFGELFPSAGKGTGRVVLQAPTGKTLNDYSAQVIALNETISKVSGVSQSISPLVNTSALSSDKRTGYITVQLKEEAGSISASTIDAIASAARAARSNGLTVELGGDIVSKVPAEVLGVGEITGVGIALIVLLLTLGSLIAAGIPLLTAFVAVGVGALTLFSFSHLVTISSTTPVMAIMLGLAVGIDYSLFIVSKYRSLLLEGYNYPEAIENAIATAGRAVIFAASTVVIALSALAVVRIPFMTTMGLAGAGTVALAAIVANSLIPALLGLAKDRIFAGKTRKNIASAIAAGVHKTEHADRKSFWYKWGVWITRRPFISIITVVVVLSIIALPLQSLKLGLPTDQYAATSTSQRKAYDILSNAFGVGFNGPLIVVVEGLPAVTEADKQAVHETLIAQYNQQVATATAAAKTEYAAQAALATTPEAQLALREKIAAAQTQAKQQQTEALAKINAATNEYAKLYQASLVANNIKKVANVQAAQAVLATDTGTSAVIQVTAKSAPSSQSTIDLINYLRSTSNQRQLTNSASVSFGVTGTAALQADINKKLSDALPEYLLVVVGLSLLILLLAFRSILVPIKATLGFLFSVAAMFGVMVAVFQWGWFGITDAPGPIVNFIPIIAIGVLFGLAMDYEFFLVSSMHEAFERYGDPKRAVLSGFGLGSKVVTAAGAIMIAVFAGFITNTDTTIQTIGFGLAFGILVDAFLVRMTLVPAIMTLLGKSAWWLPKWLSKVTPHVSIEAEE